MSDYAGDPSASDTWLALAEDPDAVLVDVRTRAEWSFVGVPDLSPLGREALFVEWQAFPSMQADPARFVDAVGSELERRGLRKDVPVYFICRSGARSAAAAAAMTAAGYSSCFNVAGGFEGRLDAARHRGTVEGWKAAGLPWVQA
ncbi:rhodanese-like domain-containing protein [Lutibaculum baratangense]|uniref:Rhodanese-related sulfurtransferase n=1 Tax=Lutibaculum baratangense AMV1 TaxID=631454 RepID=V4RI81_9HYPH|nr:rhodanese-like domain-containing protein [Lutibaculum baratangense]ESR25841.1 Rhodanese-related sulfurtransferase [Lutibaculum baratangense AMV1]